MLKIKWQKYKLNFKLPAGTSRGVLKTKDSYIIKVWDSELTDVYGIGECNLFKGLSYDDKPNYEQILDKVKADPQHYLSHMADELREWPSIRFGLEMAFLDFLKTGRRSLFSNSFTEGENGIPINGLIWMGEKNFMKSQIKAKIDAGFRCLKLKIGAINFEDELDLLKAIRDEFNEDVLELRVDANGAFAPQEAMAKLNRLSKMKLQSIEQPIRQGQVAAMAKLCKESPLPIALDEELIGILELDKKGELLDNINPQFIIIKPALLGGFKASEEWIALADKRGILWWITSALESNIGLNAIAQWTSTLHSNMYQGLGTGQLFTNNFESPLQIQNAELWHTKTNNWDLSSLTI